MNVNGNLGKSAQWMENNKELLAKYLKAGLGAGVLASGLGLAASRMKAKKEHSSLKLEDLKNAITVDIRKDKFMEGLPTSLIEAAKIDGATEWCVFSKIVMPNVKPAWLTLIIFSVQALWNNPASTVIYSEEMKTLPFAMQQIQAGGIARTGEAAAVLVVLMIVPIAIFIFSESQILETMASSGLKD